MRYCVTGVLALVLMATGFGSRGEPLGGARGIAEPVTLQGVVDFVRSHHEIRSIDELLSELPRSYLSNFTLMHTSHSLQTATAEAPRAIVFGPDARLILAFSGDPKTDRYDSLEMIGFHDDTASFEMREIRFPEDTARPEAEISDANPKLCLSCHTADPRPNWEHYNHWPGAFASDDDEFPGAEESMLPALQRFLDDATVLPRYRHLVDVKAGYGGGGGRTSYTHNIKFTERVATLNFRRIARLARATPHWAQYKYLAMGMVWCAEKIADFIPTPQRARFEPYFAKLKRQSYAQADSIRYLFEARGIPIRPWYLDFVTPPDERSFGTPGWPYWEFGGPIVDGDPDLEAFFTVANESYEGADFRKAQPISTERSCTGLAKRSQEALATLRD